MGSSTCAVSRLIKICRIAVSQGLLQPFMTIFRCVVEAFFTSLNSRSVIKLIKASVNLENQETNIAKVLLKVLISRDRAWPNRLLRFSA